MTYPLRSTIAIRIFTCFAFGYFLSYALRSVNAAIAPGLVRDLNLSASELGNLSSAYLLFFAILQLPMGSWLDRYGPRKTEAALLLVAALGCFVFALAHTFLGAWTGRALIGAGVSGCLMAAYKGFREYFPLDQQQRLASWMLMAGTAGVLTTTIPVQYVVTLTGWRPVFMVAGGLLLMSSAAIFVGLPKDAAAEEDKQRTSSQFRQYGLMDVAREAYFWRLALLGIVFTGGFIALQSLWLGPWLTNVLAYSPAAAANILFAFNLVLFWAYFAMSWLIPRAQQHGLSIPVIAIAMNAVGLVVLFAASWFTRANDWWIWLALPACTTINTLAQTYINGYFPRALAGRANAMFNLLIFAGAFCLQSGLGLLIDFFKTKGASTIAAYQQSIWVYLGLALVAWLVFTAWRPKPPQFDLT